MSLDVPRGTVMGTLEWEGSGVTQADLPPPEGSVRCGERLSLLPVNIQRLTPVATEGCGED